MITTEQAWDAVLAIQTDLERIVSQAVRFGRVRKDDSEDTLNSAMVSSVALAERYDGTIEQFKVYALATFRRSVRIDVTRLTDAMDRVAAGVEIPELAGNSPSTLENSVIAKISPKVEFQGIQGLTPLENCVAGLLASGKPIGQVARQLGTTVRGVKTVAGMAEAKIRRMGKPSFSSGINGLGE
jgi:DNA-binding CsgD family transcriptional regulator